MFFLFFHVCSVFVFQVNLSNWTIIDLFVFIFIFFRDRIYALQRQKERLEEQVDLANKALAESAIKPKK